MNDLLALPVMGASGSIVPLGEFVTTEERVSDVSIYRKNLMPVVYVSGDVAGAAESPVSAILKMNRALAALDMEVLSTHQPFSTEKLAMKWDGEWHITYEVFRDLGAAFAVVLVLIYVLVVGWFRSFGTRWDERRRGGAQGSVGGRGRRSLVPPSGLRSGGGSRSSRAGWADDRAGCS